jgi:hypothetical protein
MFKNIACKRDENHRQQEHAIAVIRLQVGVELGSSSRALGEGLEVSGQGGLVGLVLLAVNLDFHGEVFGVLVTVGFSEVQLCNICIEGATFVILAEKALEKFDGDKNAEDFPMEIEIDGKKYETYKTALAAHLESLPKRS